MAKRSAARREEWRQERIEAIGRALASLLTTAGAGNKVNVVSLAEVAVDALDAHDNERRQRIQEIADQIRVLESEKPTLELRERRSIVFDFDAIRKETR